MTAMDDIIAGYHALKAIRAPWEGWWDELRRYVLPGRPSDRDELPDARHHRQRPQVQLVHSTFQGFVTTLQFFVLTGVKPARISTPSLVIVPAFLRM